MQWHQKQHVWFWVISVIAVAVALVLFNPFDLYFLNDDFIHIPLSAKGELFQRRSFRPVGDLCVQLDYYLWGKDAHGYHLSNLLLHVANSLLVAMLANHLFKRYDYKQHYLFRSIMVGVLFFVYAFHSEAVFWILGRSASLGTLLFIPALIFYIRRHNSFINFIVSLLFFTGSLLAYESVWIFPIVVMLFAILDIRLDRSNTKKEALYLSAILIVFAAYAVVRFRIINEMIGPYEASNFLDFGVLTLAVNFFKLIVRSFAPPVSNNLYFSFISVEILIILSVLGFRA
jgi:hypothetical protein